MSWPPSNIPCKYNKLSWRQERPRSHTCGTGNLEVEDVHFCDAFSLWWWVPPNYLIFPTAVYYLIAQQLHGGLIIYHILHRTKTHSFNSPQVHHHHNTSSVYISLPQTPGTLSPCWLLARVHFSSTDVLHISIFTIESHPFTSPDSPSTYTATTNPQHIYPCIRHALPLKPILSTPPKSTVTTVPHQCTFLLPQTPSMPLPCWLSTRVCSSSMGCPMHIHLCYQDMSSNPTLIPPQIHHQHPPPPPTIDMYVHAYPS